MSFDCQFVDGYIHIDLHEKSTIRIECGLNELG